MERIVSLTFGGLVALLVATSFISYNLHYFGSWGWLAMGLELAVVYGIYKINQPTQPN